MSLTLALGGDTMLGRGVGERLLEDPPEALFSPEVAAFAREADLTVVNLECCISDRGSPWPDPAKPFFFRAPPVAVEALVHLGVDCVTLANNHALDFGEEALLDTIEHLAAAGIVAVGAGPDLDAARRPAVVEANGSRLVVVGLTDHPADFAAGSGPGVAFADLRAGVPEWVRSAIRRQADAALVTPHWGPNMTPRPVPHVRRAADQLVDGGSSLVAGHSAHVFHGVRGRVLFDLGDLLDDYAVDQELRNDLGLLWRVTLEEGVATRVDALPIRLEYCFTRGADREEASWIGSRFRAACAELGTGVREAGGILTVDLTEGVSGRAEGM